MSINEIGNNKIFGGQQLRFEHAAESVNCTMQFSVYLPEQSNAGKVPVLYWLSGLTCTDENFVQKAGAQQYASELGVAIVAPDTSPRGDDVPDDPEGAYDFGLGAGFYVNATEAPWDRHYQMYDYISRELSGLIEAEFPVDPDRCGIFGHSMGGHGALTIGMKNPARFKSISAFAPISSPLNCPWGHKALNNYIGADRSLWGEYDACELARTLETVQPVLIDQGDADQFLAEQLKPELLKQAFEAAGHAIELRMQPGYDHSYFFIATFIEDHMRFHADKLNR
jgi:S-formylglutathione hydrolase